LLDLIFRNHHDAGPFVQAIFFDDDGRTLIRLAHDNQPPAEGRYVCSVPVRDYWRLLPNDCLRNNVSHFATAIESAVIQDVRNGRALLLLDLSNEGPEFQRSCFDAIHDFLDRNGIAGRQAVWLSQNRAIEPSYLAAYAASRGSLLRFEYYDFYIKMMANWFADSSWRADATGHMPAYASALNDPVRKTHFALCLNATPRLHRVCAVAALQHYRILDRCLVSFSGMSYAKGIPLDATWIRTLLQQWRIPFLNKAFDEIVAMGPIQVDEFADTGNQLVDKIDVSTYLRTCFSIVTETDFSDGTIDRITEKTIKAFCLGHPAFIIGNPGAMRIATNLGFQDFAPALPVGYDSIESPPIRFVAVMAEILAQVSAIQRDPAGWAVRVAEVSRYNINHSSGGLLRAYKDGHDKRVAATLEKWLVG